MRPTREPSAIHFIMKLTCFSPRRRKKDNEKVPGAAGGAEDLVHASKISQKISENKCELD